MDIPELQDIEKLYSFGNVKVVGFDLEGEGKNQKVVLYGELTDLRCSRCKSDLVSKRSKYVKDFADCRALERPAILRIVGSRVDCHNRKVPHDKGQNNVNPYIEDLPPGSQMTPRLKVAIANEDFFHQTFKAIGEKYGVTANKVKGIFLEKAQAFDADLKKYPECTMIGIDEIHIGDINSGSRNRMCATIVDLSNEKSKLLDVLPKNTKNTVIEALNLFPSPEKIKWVTMDMNSGYRAAVEECLPNAKIIIDRFHVEKYLYDAVNEALKRTTAFYSDNIEELSDKADRIEQRERFSNRPYSVFWFRKKKSTYDNAIQLLKDVANGTKEATPQQIDDATKARWQFQKLMTLLKAYPKYRKTYSVCNAFSAMFDANTREEAFQAFNDAKALLPEKKLKDDILAPFWKFVATVESKMDMILNYFDAAYEPHRSNGPVEEWNGQIKRAFNQGWGYSFPILRWKVLIGSSQVEMSKDFKLLPESSEHTLAAAAMYSGADEHCSERTMNYFRSIVRGIAKTPEMEGNTFVAEVAKNIDTVGFDMLREVFVTYPSLSFRVAEELDNHLSANGSCVLYGATLEDFIAAYNFVGAQVSAHLEDETILDGQVYDIQEEDDGWLGFDPGADI